MLPASRSQQRPQSPGGIARPNPIEPIVLDTTFPQPGPSTSNRKERIHDSRQSLQGSPDTPDTTIPPLTRPRPQTLQLDLDAITAAGTPDTNSPVQRRRGSFDLTGGSSSLGTPCWDKFRAACRTKKYMLMNWFAAKAKKVVSLRSSRSPSLVSTIDMAEEVEQFLNENQDFFQEYVINRIPLAIFEELYFLKIELEMDKIEAMQCDSVNTVPTNGQREYIGIPRKLSKQPAHIEVIWELASSISLAIQGDAFRVYKILPGSLKDIVEVFSINEQGDSIVLVATRPHILVLEAARLVKCMIATRTSEPLQLSDTTRSVFKLTDSKANSASYVTIVPIMAENGEASYVIEVWKSFCYRPVDEEIAANFMVWGSLAMQKKESELTDFLLTTVKAIFEEMVSLDQVIKRILQFAQKLVDADRASLFLVDYKNNELVSTVFDLKLHGQDSNEKKEIRMPITRGIAGHVALTGEYVNISDAYSDKRFNRAVDEATGYETTSILCMPVKIEGKIIGVVQMVNKRKVEKFCREDEKSFNIFATFFGLALHHARLYDKIIRKEQKYRVALEVLSYHNTCRDTEVEELVLLEPHHVPYSLTDFYLDPFALNVVEKCQAVMIMFHDLFNMKNFDNFNVTRFILTVKKNYRDVPYHNFHHGWSVAQTMYVILKNDASKNFNYKQRLALFVASLCHDLDHRGYTNKYMSETASPLAAMYTTSTLEHHHFNITVTILQQDGHNIFSRFSSEEYKDMLGLIRTCILATDLAAFFPNLVQMKQLCGTDERSYNWENLQHRELAMAMSMTAADLSASAKPWDVQNKTVKVIFEEFYDQGDKERAAGRKPIPMMDRDKPEEQPASQVGFLTQICLPCYEMLQIILPNTSKLLEMASNNLEKWSQKADEAIQLKQDKISLDAENVVVDYEVNEDVTTSDSPSPDESDPNQCAI